MKKEIETAPVKVYSDPVHEAKTRIELEKARVSLQACLDIWNGLNMVPCTDIFALIMNPQTVYGSAVNQLAEPPVQTGRFKISKEAYINTLEIPVPDSLYRAAREARKQTFCAMPELWTVSESGLNVVLDETEGGALIDSQSIYLSDPDKITKVENVIKMVELMNIVNREMKGQFMPPSPHVYQFIDQMFTLTQKTCEDMFELKIDPAFLRSLLR
jgi:hypothetical protein